MWKFANDLGAYASAFLIVTSFVALSVLCVEFVKRFLPWFQFDKETSDLGQIFGGAIGTLFALVFAMVTVAVWQNYDRVQNAVGEEANALHSIYTSLETYPPAVRNEARGLLHAYVKEVVTHEWAVMKERETLWDSEAQRLFDELSAALTGYRPRDQGELPLHGEVLTQLSRSRSLRQDRVRAGVVYLDTGMWISLAAGTVVLMLFCSAWRVPGRKQHYLMAGAMGASLGIVFFLMLSYNHPFQGHGAVGPAPFLLYKDLLWK